MKTVEEFVNELKENQELKDEMVEIETEDEAKKFMEKYEISGTAQELSNAVEESMMVAEELSDDELEKVAGGELEWGKEGSFNSREEVVFEFNVGDRVETDFIKFFYNFTRRGTIIERYAFKRNEHKFYPCYKVKLDNGDIIELYQPKLSR